MSSVGEVYVAVVEHGENGQQISSGLAGSRLCYAEDVASVEHLRNAFLLYGRHFLEAHVVERVEDIIIQICFFKCHLIYDLVIYVQSYSFSCL